MNGGCQQSIEELVITSLRACFPSPNKSLEMDGWMGTVLAACGGANAYPCASRPFSEATCLATCAIVGLGGGLNLFDGKGQHSKSGKFLPCASKHNNKKGKFPPLPCHL